MNNKGLIKSCREALNSEDEPHQSDWIDMVESLCNALEKAEQEIKYLNQTIEYIDPHPSQR